MYKRGFTLVELVVVMAIIGILSGIIIASLDGARKSARDAKRVSDIKNIQLGLALYYSDNGRYPCQIYANIANPACPNFLGVYMSTIPKDPAGADYSYASLVAGSVPGIGSCNGAYRYHLGAALENTGTKFTEGEDYDLSTNGSGVYTISSTSYVQCSNSLNGFHGNAAACAPGTYSSTNPDPCYDVGAN